MVRVCEHAGRWVAGLGVASCLACEGEGAGAEAPTPIEVPDVEVRYRTRYVDVAPLSDAPVCAGTLAMMDDHIDHMLDLLGLEFDGRRIPMYLLHAGEPEPEPWCGAWLMNERVRGCYVGGAVFTGWFGLRHELVHAITGLRGGSWWFEGVAYAFSEVAPVPEWSPANLTEEAWLSSLGASGHFARWLIERYGGPTFMDLYARTPRHADQATVEAQVRAVLGQGLDEVLSEYAATAGYIYPDRWACHVAPTTVEAPFVDDHWTYEATLDCDAPDTFSNADLERQRMTARIPVTLPGAGAYQFIADHPDAELYLQPCLTAPMMEYDRNAFSWPIRLSPLLVGRRLEAGAHVLIVHLPPGGPTRVRLAGYRSLAGASLP